MREGKHKIETNGFSKDLLKEEKIWITGGSSGLGLSMARGFLEHGAEVLICGRKEDKLIKAVETLKAEGLDQVHHFACDVRNYDEIEACMHFGLESMGGITGLVNNAAGNFISPTERLSSNAFQTIVNIVLMGTANATMALGKHWLKNQQSGNILNIVTTYAETGSAFVVPSASAKAGVLAMTRSLASEWGAKNIRINAIAPGPFPTPGAWERLFPPSVQGLMDPKSRIPLQRFGQHEELQNLSVFLMSALSPYIHGECITIDGGEWLKGAGEFNDLLKIPEEMWDKLEAETRKAK